MSDIHGMQECSIKRNTIYHQKYMMKNQQLVTSLCLILKTCQQDCSLLGKHTNMDTNISKEKKLQPPSLAQSRKSRPCEKEMGTTGYVDRILTSLLW
jgi:hypothetical protein